MKIFSKKRRIFNKLRSIWIICEGSERGLQKDCYRTELRRVFIQKSTDGQFLIIREILAGFNSKSSPLILSDIRQLQSCIIKNCVV